MISIVRFFGQCGKKRLKTRSAFLTIRQILPIILMEMYNYVVCARNGEKNHDNRRIKEQNRQLMGHICGGRIGESAGRDRADHISDVHSRP